MPTEAILLLLLFTLASVIVGIAVTWIVGPRRPLAVILPILAAFGALWAIGHRSGLAVGPTVLLFGFEVNLLFDLLVAVIGATIVAIAQCLVAGWVRRARVRA